MLPPVWSHHLFIVSLYPAECRLVMEICKFNFTQKRATKRKKNLFLTLLMSLAELARWINQRQ